MKLDIIIDDKCSTINIAEDMLDGAGGIFEKMDRDMDKGWQMSRQWVQHPDNQQRCQIVANKLLTAVEQDNPSMVHLMAAYILRTLRDVKSVEIDTTGDMLMTEFRFRQIQPR